MTAHIALYAGSFDPITLGHLDVLGRARQMFDSVVLGIGHNPDKQALFSFEERTEMAQRLVDELASTDPAAAPVSVRPYAGLTVDFAREIGACVLVRGIRNTADLTQECQLAITNRQVAGIESVFLVTGESFAFVSSSLIRQIVALGGSLDKLTSMVPASVIERLRLKREDPDHPLSRLATDPGLE